MARKILLFKPKKGRSKNEKEKNEKKSEQEFQEERKREKKRKKAGTLHNEQGGNPPVSCLSPLSLPRPGGRGNSDRVTVPCGRCYECLSAKRNDWSFRLQEELKDARSAYFLTLTYNDENMYVTTDGEQSLFKRDVQLFLKRLRRFQEKDIAKYHSGDKMAEIALKAKIRYYTIGEYGPLTQRPHYHAIMLNVRANVAERFEEIWGLGHVKIGTVTPGSIHYVTKYMIGTVEEMGNREKPFAMISQKMGSAYLKRAGFWARNNKSNFVVTAEGFKQRIPRYYRDKLYSESVKEQMREESIKRQTARENAEIEKKGKDYWIEQDYRKKAGIEKLNRLNKKGKL